MISRQKLIEELDELDHWTQFAEHWFRCDAVYSLIRRQPPADQWIPCSERLPKETDWYPVTIQYGDEEPYIGISEYYTGEGEFYVCGKAGWYCDGYSVDDCITAWKERPEPYKGVE